MRSRTCRRHCSRRAAFAVFFVFVFSASIVWLRGWTYDDNDDDANGGWNVGPAPRNEDVEFIAALARLQPACTVKRVDASVTTALEFKSSCIDPGVPCVVYNLTSNEAFRDATRRRAFISRYGHAKVSVMSNHKAVKLDKKGAHYLYKAVDMTLGTFAKKMASARGAKEEYIFGSEQDDALAPLLRSYAAPFGFHMSKLAFGIAPAMSGVPLHCHQGGFSEVIHGAKAWWLAPLDAAPYFDWRTASEWARAGLRRGRFLARDSTDDTATPSRSTLDFSRCILTEREAMYFPPNHWHVTVNLLASVFVSAFADPRDARGACDA